MADVGNHPQPVHLGEHLKTERRKPVMFWRIGRAVGPVGCQAMRNRHVPRAKRIGLAQYFQRAANRMSALHTDHRRNFPVLHRSLGLGSAARIGKRIRVTRDHLPHDIDLLDGPRHGLVFG